MILLMYLTVVMLSEHLETYRIEIIWKMFKNMKFSKTRFSQEKKVGLGLFTVIMIFFLNGFEW